VTVNDRLLAPNTPETFEALRPALTAYFDALYGAGAYTLTPVAPGRERFSVNVTVSAPVTLAELAARQPRTDLAEAQANA
jgi:hypothetical protein